MSNGLLTRGERAEIYERAAGLIEANGLWQGNYVASDEENAPACAVGSLLIAEHGRAKAKDHAGISNEIVKHASNLLVERGEAPRSSAAYPSGVLQIFSDEGLRPDERLASPEHAAKVAQLFRDTAAWLRKGVAT